MPVPILRSLPIVSGVRGPDRGLPKVVHVASRSSTRGGRRAARAVVLHASNFLLPLTLSWTTAGQLPLAPREGGRGGTASRNQGVEVIPIALLPSKFVRTTALLSQPLGIVMPTATRRLYAAAAYGLRSSRAAVCVSGFPLATVCADTYTDGPHTYSNASQFVLPARLSDDALAVTVKGWDVRGGMAGRVRGWSGGGEWTGTGIDVAPATAPRLRARASTAPPCYAPSTPTSCARARCSTPDTATMSSAARASPFSSSCSHSRPTGAAIQWGLVGRPGGEAVRVCQGAPVRAACLGRCRVGSLFAPPRRVMAHMAAAAGDPPTQRAMVARNGAGGREASVDRAIDAVETSSAAVLSFLTCPIRPHTAIMPALSRSAVTRTTPACTARHVAAVMTAGEEKWSGLMSRSG